MKYPHLKRFPLPVSYWKHDSDQYRREQKWLAEAWEKICRAAPDISNEPLAKIRLGVKAIALALVYEDFCELAWGCGGEPESDCIAWSKRLRINEDILIKLANEEGIALSRPGLEEDRALFPETLLALSNARREEVFDILCPNQYNHGEFLGGLVAIDRTDEEAYLADEFVSASEWCSEKCYQIL